MKNLIAATIVGLLMGGTAYATTSLSNEQMDTVTAGDGGTIGVDWSKLTSVGIGIYISPHIGSDCPDFHCTGGYVSAAQSKM